MKFLHLGDLHIGRSIGDFDLKEDQEYILNEILDIAKEKEVDGILIAGDVYDRAIPSEEAVKIFDHFLCSLSANRIKTFIISGNHDSDERLNFGSSLFETSEIYIASKFDGSLYHQTIQKGEERVNVYLLPFVKASQVRHFYPDAEIENYEDAVRTVIEKANIDENETNILVAHQFVVGRGAETKLSGSEGIATQSLGLVEQIGSSVFDPFDYVALGHIHAPQQLGRETLRYSGSPLKYSKSEIDTVKSMPLINIEGGEISVELLPLRPLRDMRHLKGTMGQLLAQENINSPEDFIFVTLTDENRVNNPMNIFQLNYPNTVHIAYENSSAGEIDSLDMAEIMENKSFEELISDFYRRVYSADISDEEMKIMVETAREAGVLNEA